MFDALAAGGGGSDAARELTAARYSEHLTVLAGIVAIADRAGVERSQRAHQGYALLAEIRRRNPAAARDVILYPSVSGWALHTLRGLRSDPVLPDADPGRLSAVAAAAAIRAGMAVEIEIAAANGKVMLPALGAAQVSGGTAVVHNTAESAEVISADRCVRIPADPSDDAPGWSGLRRLRTGSLDVLIDDLDPFRMPSSAELASRLTARDGSSLTGALRQAWSLLEAYHPAVAAEVAELVRVIVPLTSSRGGHVSSSSPATFGAVGLSQPPDIYWCAVTLAHEVQHLKLSAVLDVVELTLPDNGQRYYAPWRDDPRPIKGLLQGAYAFLGVSAFWRRQQPGMTGSTRLRAETEFARWRAATAQVVETLRSSQRLTPAGLTFTEGMAKTLESWRDERVSPEAEAAARHLSERHLASWQSDNGPSPT